MKNTNTAVLAQQVNVATLSFAMMIHIQDAALALYENGSFEEDWEHDLGYRIAEISSAAKDSLPDDLKTEWEVLEQSGSVLDDFIEKGENADWELNTLPEVVFAADNYPFEQQGHNGTEVLGVVNTLVKHEDQYRGIALSLTHIHENTRLWLSNMAHNRSDVVNRSYGYLVILHADLFRGETVPLDLANIIRQCDLAGYKQIILADDADVSPALPVFE